MILFVQMKKKRPVSLCRRRALEGITPDVKLYAALLLQLKIAVAEIRLRNELCHQSEVYGIKFEGNDMGGRS